MLESFGGQVSDITLDPCSFLALRGYRPEPLVYFLPKSPDEEHWISPTCTASMLHSDSASWVWVFAHVPSPVSGVACIQSPRLSGLAAGSMDEDNNFASSLESFAAKLVQQLLTEHAWAGTVTVFHQLPVSDDTSQSFYHDCCEAHLPAAGPGRSARAHHGPRKPHGRVPPVQVCTWTSVKSTLNHANVLESNFLKKNLKRLTSIWKDTQNHE